MPAPNAAALLRSNGERSGPRRAAGDQVRRPGLDPRASSTPRRAASPACSASGSRSTGPAHVAVLLDNTPDYLFALGGAALTGAAIVGLNHTRRDEHLLRDLTHTHCGLVITEPRHVPLLDPIADRLPPVLTSRRFADGDDPDRALGQRPRRRPRTRVDDTDPGLEPDADTRWALIFTSGTSDAPKAVICTQRRFLVTGTRMGIIMDLGAEDVGYICMPLFHSNALHGRLGAVARVRRRRSASPDGSARSRWLADIRRYGSTYFNYTGKPLAYLLAHAGAPRRRRQPAAGRVRQRGLAPRSSTAFATRFGVDVIDAYGATEGGVAVNRDVEERAGALGQVGDAVQVVDEDGHALPRARFGPDGPLLNADECVGEIVNTAGAGPFEGYYNNPEANERTLRFGWYWTGDLGYLDDDRLPVLRGAQRRLAARRRRELPRPADRDDDRPLPRRRARRGVRRPRRPGRRPGHGQPRAGPRRLVRPRPASRRGSTRRRRSARSGGRATCASSPTRPRPARTRS